MEPARPHSLRKESRLCLEGSGSQGLTQGTDKTSSIVSPAGSWCGAGIGEGESGHRKHRGCSQSS